MTKQTKQIVLYASVIGAAVASVTTAAVLLINKHRKKLARLKCEAEDTDLIPEEISSEDVCTDAA